jgi:hypothetical protein
MTFMFCRLSGPRRLHRAENGKANSPRFAIFRNAGRDPYAVLSRVAMLNSEDLKEREDVLVLSTIAL